jgi:hypothetical protein
MDCGTCANAGNIAKAKGINTNATLREFTSFFIF